MELILKTNNEQSIAQIIALAQKLDVVVVQKDADIENTAKEAIKDRILNFNTIAPTSFGDAADWQKKEREDRDLPLS